MKIMLLLLTNPFFERTLRLTRSALNSQKQRTRFNISLENDLLEMGITANPNHLISEDVVSRTFRLPIYAKTQKAKVMST